MASLDGLSEYEILRLQNIERNQSKLKKLGLTELRNGMKTSVKKRVKKKAASRKRQISSIPTRQSKRLKNVPVKDYSENNIHVDQGYVSAYSSESEYSDSDESEEVIPRPKRVTRQPKDILSLKLTSKESKEDSSATNKFLTVENAKTGRSRCRKCMVQLEKGEARVGMKAWIMGRNAVTWQHVRCFLQNITVGVATNSRSRCKFSGELFQSGDLRFGMRSHTATSWVSLDFLQPALQDITRHCGSDVKLRQFFTQGDVDGLEALNGPEKKKVKAALQMCLKNTKPVPEKVSPRANRNTASKVSKGKKKAVPSNPVDLQPEMGKKTNAKGKVAWKFGGHVCFGVLLAGRETKTHCYAKTHKGNVKTLAKGKDYWWTQE